MQQNVRSNVVGEISHDIHRLARLGKLPQVDRQNVRLDDLDLRLLAEAKPKFRCQRTIQFHRDEPLRTPSQNVRNRPVPGPNLNHGARTHIAQSVSNALTRLVIH